MNTSRTGIAPIIIASFLLLSLLVSSTVPRVQARGFKAPLAQHTISRADIIARAKTWVAAQVPYNQRDWYLGYREDCSGYVSMAWGLSTPGLTTYTLPTVAQAINKDDLQPGDVLNNQNGGGNSDFAHVVIFDSWVDSAHTHYNAYEEDPYWNGAHYTTNIPYPYWPGYFNSQQDYTPMRLNTLTNPILSPTPAPNTSLLYTADWSSGPNGWTTSPEWSVAKGMLYSNGSNGGYNVAPIGSDSAMAPYQSTTADYAIEARIQILSSPDQCYLAIRGRVQQDGTGFDGYFVGFDTYFGDADIAYFTPNDGFVSQTSQSYRADTNWHTYRAEFQGNQVILKIDGIPVVQLTDSRFLNAGQVGLENGDCQIQVASFQVFALSS